ncbi:hypothetical protein L5B97_01860 [Avibacterium sp. 20-15]|uniref:hypothetical protein n=1 Tax=unclassified Avibacterium TaxID=2685287 RepID=UPI00202659BC|nr:MULTISPECIES: hypothetical protein [unclassified Avibacterium]MCW9732241.1 hypothetical protein [Avibacterium sp. 20-15]URL04412.1 hypothetical protein L4F93_00555 [Avibacterium sp. 20-132]
MKKAVYTIIAILCFGFIGCTVNIFRYYSFDNLDFVIDAYYETLILSLKFSVIAIIFSWLWDIYELNDKKDK